MLENTGRGTSLRQKRDAIWGQAGYFMKSVAVCFTLLLLRDLITGLVGRIPRRAFLGGFMVGVLLCWEIQ
jgi:hypothetical protein